jgi:hypothetical protein
MRITHFLINGPSYKNGLWAFKDFTRPQWSEDENGAISIEEAMNRIEIWNKRSDHVYSLPGEYFIEQTLDFS